MTPLKISERTANIALSKYISNLTKKELESVVWNFVLLIEDENFVEAKKRLQSELKLIRRNTK